MRKWAAKLAVNLALAASLESRPRPKTRRPDRPLPARVSGRVRATDRVRSAHVIPQSGGAASGGADLLDVLAQVAGQLEHGAPRAASLTPDAAPSRRQSPFAFPGSFGLPSFRAFPCPFLPRETGNPDAHLSVLQMQASLGPATRRHEGEGKGAHEPTGTTVLSVASGLIVRPLLRPFFLMYAHTLRPNSSLALRAGWWVLPCMHTVR